MCNDPTQQPSTFARTSAFHGVTPGPSSPPRASPSQSCAHTLTHTLVSLRRSTTHQFGHPRSIVPSEPTSSRLRTPVPFSPSVPLPHSCMLSTSLTSFRSTVQDLYREQYELYLQVTVKSTGPTVLCNPGSQGEPSPHCLMPASTALPSLYPTPYAVLRVLFRDRQWPDLRASGNLLRE